MCATCDALGSQLPGSIEIRPETRADINEIDRVNRLAFETDAEARLVARLRETEAFIAGLSLVAALGDEICGHLLLTRAAIRGEAGTMPVLALGPMCVVPEFQRSGIGSRLVQAGLACAANAGHGVVVVLGHPAYYPRFGFRRASAFGVRAPFAVPDEAFLLKCLNGAESGVMVGVVEYAAPFLELA